MREALEKVKKALTTSSIAPELAFVRVHDGIMSATDGRLYAAAPTTCRESFVVRGKQLERAIALGSNVDMKFAKDSVTFSHGRTRVKLQTLGDGDTNFPLVAPPSDAQWRDFDANFLFALHRIRAFISDNAVHAWSLAAHAHEHGVAATNNVVLANVEFSNPPVTGLIPFWLIDFLDGNDEAPVECASDDAAIYLRWDDGTWVRSLRIAGVFPEPALALLEQLRTAPRDDVWKIPDAWREAYRKTLEFADNDITVSPDLISTRGANIEVETATETTALTDRATLWDKRYLKAVLAEATHWKIDDYPKPARWYGRGIYGIVVGKTGA